MLLLILTLPSRAADFLQPDAGAPGMLVQVDILRESGGFSGSEVVTTSCPDVVVGPVVVLDRAANPSAPVTGSVLQTVFWIDEAASAGDCTVYVDGVVLSALTASLDGAFHVVTSSPGPVDGGTGDADGAADGVITIASTDRSIGGTLVLEELSVPAGTALVFDTTDPDGSTTGNEAYLGAVVLVEGAAAIDGTIDISGDDADGYGDADVSVESCLPPDGYVGDDTDCDDGEAAANPGETEVCDEIDNDCDELTDEELSSTWYADADADGYGDAAAATEDCAQPSGTVEDDTDCDDTDASVHPGADEVEGDGIDQDCDGADASAPGDDTAVAEDDGDYKGGCGCAAGGGAAGLTWALGLGGIAVRRRRFRSAR